MPSIFLAHSSIDKRFTRRLAADLLEKGVKVWFDEAEMMVGDSIIDKITHGIINTEYLGIVLSPNSVSSNWVKKEIEIAITEETNSGKIKVLPIIYEDCQIPRFLETKVWVDFRDTDSYSDSLNKLLKKILKNVDIKKQSFFESGTWTPKGVRLGILSGLINTHEGKIIFSKNLRTMLCEVGEQWYNGTFKFTLRGELIAHASIGAMAKDDKIGEVLPLTVEEAHYLINEIGQVFIRDVFRLVEKIDTLLIIDGRLKWADAFYDELTESLIGHAEEFMPSKKKANLFIKNFFVTSARSRLLLYAPDNVDLSFYIGMFLFDMFKTMPIYKHMMKEYFK